MTHRHYTLSEANDRLPDLAALLGELREARAVLLDRALIERMAARSEGNGGGEDARRHARAAITMARGLRRLDEWGVIVRDIESGLCDFPALREGREVFLCWIDGEERIGFWHEIHTGFPGRTPVDDLFT